MLTGSELVLIGQVPRAGREDAQSRARWTQAHWNRAVAEQFFMLTPGDNRSITLEKVDYDGYFAGRTSKQLVFSEVNKNPKIEFDFRPVTSYPDAGPPLLVIVELDRLRSFRYRPVMPGQDGYDAMFQLTVELPKLGRGNRRVITTLDEVELRWPNARLRNPRVRAE
jgi:hypothetical protein